MRSSKSRSLGRMGRSLARCTVERELHFMRARRGTDLQRGAPTSFWSRKTCAPRDPWRRDERRVLRLRPMHRDPDRKPLPRSNVSCCATVRCPSRATWTSCSPGGTSMVRGEGPSSWPSTMTCAGVRSRRAAGRDPARDSGRRRGPCRGRAGSARSARPWRSPGQDRNGVEAGPGRTRG